MDTPIFISISLEQFRQLLKETIREVLLEGGSPKQSTPEILNVQQAADFLKLKLNTLYEKTSRKQIPHFKKGNRLYFHLSELENWVKQGKVKTHKEIESEALTLTFNNNLRKVA